MTRAHRTASPAPRSTRADDAAYATPGKRTLVEATIQRRAADGAASHTSDAVQASRDRPPEAGAARRNAVPTNDGDSPRQPIM